MKRYEIERDEAEWRERLTPEEYGVLREARTEAPFTGEYTGTEAEGTYRCRACGTEAFGSEAKYNSGCGWPSFFEPASPDSVEEHVDLSHGMVRTEIKCGACGSHLGHVFTDGPEPTGLRYCINSVALKLDRGVPEE